MKQQKTVEDYRNTIFILKERLQKRQNEFENLKNEYTSYNVFEQTSYDWKLRQKILEVQMEQLNKEERKYLKHKASSIYGIYYAMMKLSKACDVLSVTKQMVFRGVDKKMVKLIESSDFEQHLREVYRLPSNSVNYILNHIQKQGKVPMSNYYELLQFFDFLKQQKLGKNIASKSVDKLIQILLKQRVIISGLWKQDHLDAAEFAYEITKQLKQMKVLQCIAVYYKLNPLKKLYMERREVVQQLAKLVQEKRQQVNNKRQPSINKKMLIN